MKHWRFLMVWLLGLVTACQPVGTPSSASTLRVVVTHSILGDLVQSVAGEGAEMRVLIPAGSDAHTFFPSPADGVALAQATIIFENGAGFEPWMEDVYASSGSQAVRVVVTDGLELIKVSEEEGDGHSDATPEAGHDHDRGAVDPHVWHSVAHTIQMVKTIRDGLTQVDPANAGRYQTNAEAYIQQLQDLDTWVFEQVRMLPLERRVLVTNHDTLAYFAARYGFEVLGTLLPTSTEGASPSAHEVAELAQKIKTAGVPAVFAENVAASGLLTQVADEAGITVVAGLYTDALGPAGSEGETYIKLMQFNVITLVKALSQ